MAWLSALTLLVFLIHGYHPLAEDGGIYVAGIFLKLHPTLFPRSADFVRGPMHYSLFATLFAFLSRLTKIPPLWLVLAADLFTTWFMLFSARQILRRCFQSDFAQLGGVALLAAWWTLPVAGTSLLMMDPYVTARSFSTPLTLLALAFALDVREHSFRVERRALWLRHPIFHCLLCLGLAALAHLLMAFYAFAFVIVLWAALTPKRALKFAGLGLCAIALAALLQAFALPESPAYVAAAITRYYWFLSQWQWYELAGLVGPIAVIALLLWHFSNRRNSNAIALCLSCLVLGCASCIICLSFAHESSPTHLLARLQPLRVFLPIYVLMAVLLGASGFEFAREMASRYAKRYIQIVLQSTPFAVTLVLALIMGFVQIQSFPSSGHMEMPWMGSKNSWTQAFLWIKDNTNNDALIGMDAHYISAPYEDAQVFRAIALRDALPDYSKDGGEAAVTRSLAEVWQTGMTAQMNLDQKDDATRKNQLAPFGVNWLILHSNAVTNFPCPYRNNVVKVCQFASWPR